jgi:hypothetical protein
MSDLLYSLGLDNSDFEKGAVGAETRLGSLMTAMKGLAAGFSAAAITGFFKEIIEKGGALQDLSERLDNLSTDSLQAFDFAVRQAGGTTEQATQIWDKSKKALDSLAAGNESATKQFAALGVKASDFVGLNLDQALQKIAEAYAENSAHAGAFDAITDILGTRSAPKLNAVLLQLAAEGFPQMIEKAKEAGQVMEKDAIKRFDEFGDRLDRFKGRFETWGSQFLNYVMKGAESVAALESLHKSFLTGTEVNVSMLGASAEKAEKAVKKVLPALVETTEQLAAHKKLTEERTKFEDMVLKQVLAEMAPRERLVELQKQYLAHAAAAVAAGKDSVKAQEEMNKGAELALQYRKLTLEEEKRRHLTLKEEIEILELQKKRQESLTEVEARRLSILLLQKKEKQLQVQIDDLAAKLVTGTITPAEQKKLLVLTEQTREVERKIKLVGDSIGQEQNLINLSKEQLDAQRVIVETSIAEAKARGLSTAELEHQLDLIRQILGASNQVADNFVAIQRGGKDYESQSTASLQGALGGAKKQLQEIQEGEFQSGNHNPFGTMLQFEIGRIQSELASRSTVFGYASKYGEDAARRQYGDTITDRALRDMQSDSQRTRTAAEDIKDTLNRLFKGKG